MLKSVSAKIIAVFIVLILPLNLLFLIQSDSMVDNMVERVRMMEQSVVDIYAADLEDTMKNAASLLHYFRSEDSDCISMTLQSEKNYTYISARMKLYTKLKNMSELVNGADGYFYYMPKLEDLLVYCPDYSGKEGDEELKAAIQAGLLEGLEGWKIIEYGEERKQYALLFVELKDISYGAWIDLEEFYAAIFDELEYENMELAFSETAEEWKDERDYDVVVFAETKGIRITLSLDQREIIQTNAVYQIALMRMAIMYLALIPILYLFVRKLLIQPLNQINLAHHQIEIGNQDYQLEERASSSEFQEAYHSFNTMADNLKTYRIQAYENKIEKQQMELRNLQLQIRPHFLLNTFNLIYSLAQNGDSASVQKITIYLSEYFRYIFRSDKEMELFSKERNLIEEYIEMASIRYEGRIKLTVDLDPEIEFVRTPPLLIHNFVENSVKYGIRQGKELHIDLQGRYKDGWVIFQVTDDGNGMTPEILERNQKVFSHEIVPKDKNEHLGLYNSLKRLNYFYGESASIEVMSEPGEITCFTIQFPYNLEAEDESFNG